MKQHPILVKFLIAVVLMMAFTVPALAGTLGEITDHRVLSVCHDGVLVEFTFTGSGDWHVWLGPVPVTLAYGAEDGSGSFSGTLFVPADLSGVATVWVTFLSGHSPVSSTSYDVMDCEGVSVSSGSKAGPPAMNLYDGRINNSQGHDVAAPVAIYDGSLRIYSIDQASGAGRLSIDLSDEAIEAAGVPVDVPLLLDEAVNMFTGANIAVYRLTTGEFQVNTRYADGKEYIAVWGADNSGVYHLAW